MKKTTILFSFLVVFITTVSAQVPRFTKYQINETGRYAYFPEDPGTVEPVMSDDGSDVYTYEVEFENTFYGTIMVDFTDDAFKENSKEEMEEVLISYLDYLQGAFSITETAGYGKGHTLESNPDAVGVLDYWEDATGEPWVIKGWVDQNSLAVMYMYSTELPAQGIQDVFLNGFRFN